MKLWTASLLLLVATPSFGRIAETEERELGGGGGVTTCKYKSKKKVYLRSGKFIEPGEGLCAGDWTFGITEGKEKLQLLEGDKVKWTAGEQGIGNCRMNKGGSFACYEGPPSHPGKLVWALNCGGRDGAKMKLDSRKGQVLKMVGNKKKWAVNRKGKEVGNC